ncbi:MAG: 3-oxoacid CoA-transferase subunit A [Halanaerobium sp.]|nr:3-oxoacid CoA-transferase subunit A [Halanaerobium sp.]
MEKVKSLHEAIGNIREGSVVMIPGFLTVGTPGLLVDALVDSGVGDLTVICNDTAFPERGIGKLICNRQVKKVITSHIGTNKETGRQMNEGELEVELVPQGTLIEQIRAAGAGLGGILTPTGIGTVVEEGKEIIEVNGQRFLLELPLRADVALLKAKRADHAGNLVYDKTARNFNPLIAIAADLVIAEADEIVEDGEIDPDHVVTQGIFVDMIVKGRDSQ